MNSSIDTPLTVIVGETASGKTALAIEVARRFNGEIICADSATVRRQADIGSAKPSDEERALVPHHLLDVVDADEEFTAASFKQLANEAIADIAGRGKLPIIVGGTGLYIDGLIYDYDFLPPADSGEREALNLLTTGELLAQAEKRGIELGDVDVQNKRRLVRLIETNGVRPTKNPLREHTLVIGLQPERAVIEERIIKRVDAMLEAGLEAEVRALVAQYGWDCEALKGIGYSQWRDYFSGQDTLQETRQKIIKANLDFAKRQRTWFKRNKSIHWLTTPVNQTEVDELITTFLSN